MTPSLTWKISCGDYAKIALSFSRDRCSDVVLDASIEVRSAVVYATFAVAFVFVPILTMSGVAGRLFESGRAGPESAKPGALAGLPHRSANSRLKVLLWRLLALEKHPCAPPR